MVICSQLCPEMSIIGEFIYCGVACERISKIHQCPNPELRRRSVATSSKELRLALGWHKRK